jgi:hypothetical protein
VGDSIDPPRNFSLSLEERVRALAGPPAYIRRKRAIEDLEETLVVSVRAHLAAGLRGDAIATRTARDLTRVNELIDAHNRYYPIEANLPYHPRTGQLLERVGGRPWAPLRPWSLDRLHAEVACSTR